MSYAYKAHGCASLALQRGMDADTVCAPYASYLALAVAPGQAVVLYDGDVVLGGGRILCAAGA